MRQDRDRSSDDSTPALRIRPEGGKWAVVPDGAGSPIRVFDTREDALSWAGRSMNHQGAGLIVHNEDGSVDHTIRPNA